MANRCAGIDPTWAHLPAPAPAHAGAAGHCGHSTSPWLFPAAAFENEALTSALRASMSPLPAAASPASYPTTPSSSSTSSPSELLSGGGGGGHDAAAPASRPGPPPARAGSGPKSGRVTKRKPRPSRRPPPTYIMADPANFRRMVQEVTGFPVASSGARRQQFAASEEEPASATAPRWSAPPACALPTLDTSAFFLLDQHAVAAPAMGANDKSSSGGASPAMAVTVAAVEDDDSSVFEELEAMACPPAFVSDFPTLESWGI